MMSSLSRSSLMFLSIPSPPDRPMVSPASFLELAYPMLTSTSTTRSMQAA